MVPFQSLFDVFQFKYNNAQLSSISTPHKSEENGRRKNDDFSMSGKTFMCQNREGRDISSTVLSVKAALSQN